MEKEKATAKAVKKTASKTKLPTLDELLQAGVHFGHKKSAWHPKMAQYIYDVRGGVHIIDLIKSLGQIKSAIKAIEDASENGHILIVGTKGQAASVVEKMAEDSGAFYVNKRWPGGLFTNFKTIKKSVDKLMKMEETVASGAKGMVKKEELVMRREIERLNKIYKGIKLMDKLPALVIVIDSKVEKNAIKEARLAGIPVVALVDTNCDPDPIKYPIAANDDSIKSISLFVTLFGQALGSSNKAISLVTMRKENDANLRKAREQFEADVERQRSMEEQEKERLKAMREGRSIDPSTVRIVGKSEK